MTAMTPRTATSRLPLAGAAIAAAVLVAGCRGDISDKPPRQFFPDMDEQPKYTAQGESHFFDEYVTAEDGERYGRTQRMPDPRTIAYGARPDARLIDGRAEPRLFEGVDFARRGRYLGASDAVYLGKRFQTARDGTYRTDEAGERVFEYVEYIPAEIPVTQDLIDLGREQYAIYCTVCHGGIGDGKGTVGVQWVYALPSYHQPQYYHGGEKGQDGYLFHVIRNGVPNDGGKWPYKMRPYASKVSVEETWAIVAYLRVLQQAQNATLDEVETVDPAARPRLERTRPPGPAAARPVTEPEVSS